MTLRLLENRIDHFGAATLDMNHGWVHREPKFKSDTPIGTVCATTTCRVVILGKEKLALTASDARKLAENLREAAWIVEQHEAIVRGDHVHRVTVREGVATLAIQGESFTMRQQTTRPLVRGFYKNCSRCRCNLDPGSKHWSSWRIYERGWRKKPRIGEQRLCIACFDACVVDETPKIERVK